MKASQFIEVALIDQMQQIADLGLWYHIAKLIPSGMELLARVVYMGPDDGMVFGPLRLEDIVDKFYKEYLPQYPIMPKSKKFFSIYSQIWLTSDERHKGLNLQEAVESGALTKYYLHVPQWFEDFKTACQTVLGKIASGELQDIEVLKMRDE